MKKKKHKTKMRHKFLLFEFDMIAKKRDKSSSENGYKTDDDALNEDSKTVFLCHTKSSEQFAQITNISWCVFIVQTKLG